MCNIDETPLLKWFLTTLYQNKIFSEFLPPSYWTNLLFYTVKDSDSEIETLNFLSQRVLLYWKNGSKEQGAGRSWDVLRVL